MTKPADFLVDIDGPTGVLTFNRPEVRNAISDDQTRRLRDCFEELLDSDLRSLIITGAGSAFSSGADVRGNMKNRLDELPGSKAMDGWRRKRRRFSITSMLHDMDMVTIAAVNGPAVGFGLDVALSCDFIIAAQSASFAASFIARGLVADGGGMYYLPRRIGLARAKEMLFEGRAVGSEEALEIGLADKLVADGSLVDEAKAFAARFAEQPRSSVLLTKAIVNETFELTRDQVAALVNQAQAMCYTTDEHRDLVQRYLSRPKDKR